MYTFTTTTATTTTIYLEKSFGIGPVDRLSWQPAATKSSIVRITSIKSALNSCLFFTYY